MTDAEGHVLELAAHCGITSDGNLARYFASEKALLLFAEHLVRSAYRRGRQADPSEFLKERDARLAFK